MKDLSNVRNAGVDRKGRYVRESVKEQNKEGEESQVIDEISDNSSFNCTTMGMPVTSCTTLVGDSKSAHGLSQNETLAEMFSRLEQRLENKFEQFANTLESIKQSIETGSDRKAETERFEVSHTNINKINGKVENHIAHSNEQVSGIMTQFSERLGSLKTYIEDSHGSTYQDIDKNSYEIQGNKYKIQRHANTLEKLSRSTTALQPSVTKVHDTVQLFEHRMMVMGQGLSDCLSHSTLLSGVPENQQIKFNGDSDNNSALIIKSHDDYSRLNGVLGTEKQWFMPHVMTVDTYIKSVVRLWSVRSNDHASSRDYASIKGRFFDKSWDKWPPNGLNNMLSDGYYDFYRKYFLVECITKIYAEVKELCPKMLENGIMNYRASYLKREVDTACIYFQVISIAKLSIKISLFNKYWKNRFNLVDSVEYNSL